VKLIATSGCFDILHAGHVSFLERCKALGDALLVLVNCDEYVCRMKGPDRPVSTLPDRMAMLQSLTCVDFVCPFYEDTPGKALLFFTPDIFAKGTEYASLEIVEELIVHSYGGIVLYLPRVVDESSSRLLGRI
jgi:rfaE bifunctional protein nucleotidyltransferase chain/domain